ncbi:hypothetical protein Tco_1419318 [Tanacetum coccineum]
MSNSNTNLQTQSSNALHNAIMEAGSKDRPPMLALGVQINLTGIDNDIYSTVDACQNACEMWKTIERFKQVLTSTTTRMAKQTPEMKVNEIRTKRIACTAYPLALVARQQPGLHTSKPILLNSLNIPPPDRNSLSRIEGSNCYSVSAPTYDPEPAYVTEDEEMSKENG